MKVTIKHPLPEQVSIRDLIKGDAFVFDPESELLLKYDNHDAIRINDGAIQQMHGNEMVYRVEIESVEGRLV